MKKLLATLLLAAGTAQAADTLSIDVYRDPNCGCCKAWITHLTENGFTVNDHVTADMQSLKHSLGVPPDLASCHTGTIQGRFIEGHVPASDIKRSVTTPDIAGLAVPGMPIGSPGMEMGGRQDPYSVVSLSKDGERQVFSRYPEATLTTAQP